MIKHPKKTKLHGASVLVRVIIKDIDENPVLQERIHTIGFWYWTVNFPIITYLFFYQPVLWLKYGLFITLIYSIYANWTSDYTGMSASQGLRKGHGTEVEEVTEITDYR